MKNKIQEWLDNGGSSKDYEGFDAWLDAFCPPPTDKELNDMADKYVIVDGVRINHTPED